MKSAHPTMNNDDTIMEATQHQRRHNSYNISRMGMCFFSLYCLTYIQTIWMYALFPFLISASRWACTL